MLRRGCTFSAGLVAAALLFAPLAHAGKISSNEVEAGDDLIQAFHLEGASHEWGDGTLKCAPGLRVFSGGAFLYVTGTANVPQNTQTGFVVSSAPTRNGKGWYASAVDQAGPDYTLLIVVRCLPRRELRQAKTVIGSTRVGGSLPPNEVKVTCPAGHRLISGGGYISRPGLKPEAFDSLQAYISSSAPATPRKWYVNASDDLVMNDGRRDLNGVPRCMPSDHLADYDKLDASLTVPDDSSAVDTFTCPDARVPGPAGVYWHDGDSEMSLEFAESAWPFALGTLQETNDLSAGGNNSELTDIQLSARAYCLK
jgi:hypothetical protein